MSRNLLQAGSFAGSKSQWDNFSLWLNRTDRPPGNWASPAHLEEVVRYHCTFPILAMRMNWSYAKHLSLFYSWPFSCLFVVWPTKFPPDCLLVSVAIIKSQHKVRSHKVASGARGLSCLELQARSLSFSLLCTLSWPRFNRGWPRAPSDQWTLCEATYNHCKHALRSVRMLHPPQRFNCFHLMGVVAELVV